MRISIMRKKIDEYLLKKYSIPQMAYDSQTVSGLCDILRRLNKNKKLDVTDKKWIRDKGMVRFYKFLENWEKVGTADLYTLHESYLFPYKSYMAPRESATTSRVVTSSSIPLEDNHTSNDVSYPSPPVNHTVLHIDNTKDSNKSKQNPIKSKNKQDNNYSFTMKIRKQNMHSYYNKVKLAKNIESNFTDLTPSKIPKDISSLILDKIWNAMHDSIQKDVKELFKVYACQQWTATSLMAMRLLENVLKIHLECDLKEKPIKDMGDAINKLEEHEYDYNLLVRLREYKEERNNLMHGNNRAGASDAKRLVVDIMTIVMSIHNIRS